MIYRNLQNKNTKWAIAYCTDRKINVLLPNDCHDKDKGKTAKQMHCTQRAVLRHPLTVQCILQVKKEDIESFVKNTIFAL